MNLLKAYDNTQGSIGDEIELSHDDLDAVNGGSGDNCTTKYGTCRDTGGGHVVCTPTVVTCK
jgi:hypothetical protein